MIDYKRAVKNITDRRRADLDAGLEVWRNALRGNAELHSAYVKYQDEAIKNAQRLPNELTAARDSLAAAAKKAGLKKSDIEPPCRCDKCKDSGYVNGRYCGCVIKNVITSNSDNLTLPLADFGSARSTAPKTLKKLYDAAENFINSFPDGDKPFFVIVGSSGTGKTILESAIATELMQRGAAAVTISAFEFVKRAKDYHTQFAIDDYVDLFTPMLDCDVLCIDDLGTEAMLKNVTREYLYSVINERWLRKKYTVVSTNLTPDALLSRYGEAIFSRLCDKSVANLFIVAAANLRTKKQ